MELSKSELKLALHTLARNKGLIVTVYLMLLSYFYNLPVLSYSAKGNNELRLYDLAGLSIVYFYFKNYNLVNVIINSKLISRSLYYFLLWANFTFILTVIFSIANNKIFWIFQTLLYLYHFWVFFLASMLLIVIIQDLKQLARIVTFTLIIASITFIIVTLQNFGFIPFLWNKTYLDAYDGFMSGTLGPNKIVLGITCLIIFGLGMGLMNDKRVKINKLLLVTTIALSAVVIVISGSRTAYVGIGVFLFYFFIKETKSFIYSSVILVIGISAISLINPEILNKATEVYEGRVEKKIKNPNEIRDGDVGGLYEDLGAGRNIILYKYLRLLGNDPIYIPFGRGFNNRMDTSSSAHNTYLSLIYEVGIVGMVIYFRWLFSYMFVRMRNFPHLEMAAKGLAFSMIVTLFFGEHLYIYRALFGLLGLFMFIMTLIMSPLYILESEQE